MGDRALIQLKVREGRISPVLYLHWGGSEVANILARSQERMKGRPADVDYAFARLVQQATGEDQHNTGIGVWNQDKPLTADDSHGDAGCFVVDVTEERWTIQQGGGYGLNGDHHFPVTTLAGGAA